MDLDAGVEQAIELIQNISLRNPQVTVMACSTRNDADVVIRAMQAGAREFLTEPLLASTVDEALIRAASRRQTCRG